MPPAGKGATPLAERSGCGSVAATSAIRSEARRPRDFVANACPKLQPNLARFLAAVQALGLTKADLDREELKGIYIGYAALYSADVKTSCERADAQFGPHGTTLAGIFDAR